MALPVNRASVTVDVTRTNPAVVVTTRPNRVKVTAGPGAYQELKDVVAASSDFADFQARMAAL